MLRCYTNPIWLKIESPVVINIHLTTLIEGFFNPITQSMNIQNTLRVEMRNNSFPYSKIDLVQVLVDMLGKTAARFEHAETGDYYIVIRHRNCINTWSRAGGEHLVKGIIFSYDFTSDLSQSYGVNLIQIGNKWCIYSVDANQDGNVDFHDMYLINSAGLNYSFGDSPADISGEGFIVLFDIVICDNNIFNQIQKITP